MSITIRSCTHLDAGALSKIGASTFYETWRPTSTEDNIQLYIGQTFTEDEILKHLKSTTNFFYVGEDEGQLIGYVRLRISDEIPEHLKNYRTIEIAQIYVRANYHGKKAGAILMQQALKHATELNFEYVWLSAWENNIKAKTFYEKFGFEVFGKHKFIYGTQIDEDLLMKKKLS